MAKQKQQLKYTPDELKEKIEAYFEDCKGRVLTDTDGDVMYNKYGQPIVIDRHPPTVTGLARTLGFRTRMSLYDYKARPATKAIVEDALMRIQEYAEGRLYDKDGVAGAKFVLQNCYDGWNVAALQKAEANAPVVNIIADIPRPVRAADTDPVVVEEETEEPDAGE